MLFKEVDGRCMCVIQIAVVQLVATRDSLQFSTTSHTNNALLKSIAIRTLFSVSVTVMHYKLL